MLDTLVTVFDSVEDCKAWERHQTGDEVLVALSGLATFIIEAPDGVQQHILKAGDALAPPAGCWRTADVMELGRILFLT